MGDLETTHAHGQCARERALLVSEEMALDLLHARRHWVDKDGKVQGRVYDVAWSGAPRLAWRPGAPGYFVVFL